MERPPTTPGEPRGSAGFTLIELVTVIALSIERDHIHTFAGCGAGLAEHGRYLSPVIGRVVHHVLDHLPERCGAGGTAEQPVFLHLLQLVVAHRIDQGAHLLFERGPRGSQLVDGLELVERRQARGRVAAPA